MPEIPIDILPGGMLSDIAENKLGYHQHQEIRNFRIDKKGEWNMVEGFKEVFADAGVTNIKGMIEVSDDKSGDRFLLIQDGQNIKRIDYDIVGSPLFGYENEVPATLTLPTGVTIAVSSQLRFFYFRGIVRITGASEPLWYGFISRTLFLDSWDTLDHDDFEAGVASWIGINATRTHSAAQFFMGSHSFQITQVLLNGYGYQAFVVTSGRRYRARVWIFKDSGTGGTGEVRLSLGSTPGGTEYTSIQTEYQDGWTKLETEVILATGTTLYANLNPGVGESSDIAFFDEFWLEECDGLEVDDWFLYPASLNKLEINSDAQYRLDTHGSLDYITCFAKVFVEYDNSQYSLLEDLDVNPRTDTSTSTGVSFEVLQGNFTYGQLYVRIPSSIIARVTGIGIVIGTVVGRYYDPTTIEWKVVELLDIDEKMEDVNFSEATGLLYYDNANPNRIDLSTGYTPPAAPVNFGYCRVGSRIRLRNVEGELESHVTAIGYVGTTTTLDYIELADPVGTLVTNPAVPAYLGETNVTIYRDWELDGDYYENVFVFEALLGDNYWVFVDIPDGTLHNTPNYKHFSIIEERGYVSSLEDEEEDSVRYSPDSQFDNYPILNLMQTEVGDVDSIQAIVKRSDRLVMLKSTSISQGGYLSGEYNEDIGLAKFGLYTPFGFLVIGDDLFFMDREDIYSFRGIEPMPLMANQEMKNIYKQYLSSTSFLAYDHLNNELYVFLNGKILFFQFRTGAWFVRTTDLTPVCWCMSFDKKMFLASANRIVSYNHELTTYDENINYYIRTKIIDDKTAEFLKKVNKIKVLLKSDFTMQITCQDPNNSTLGTFVGTIISNATYLRHFRISPKFLFKQLELIITGTGSYANATATINNIRLLMEDWNDNK